MQKLERVWTGLQETIGEENVFIILGVAALSVIMIYRAL